MFNFNLKRTAIYRTVKLGKLPIFRFFKFFSYFILILFIISLSFFFYGLILSNFSKAVSKKLLGLSIFLFVSYLALHLKKAFFDLKLKKPKLDVALSEVVLNPENYNLAEFLGFESAKSVTDAMNSCRSEEVTSTHILYFLLKNNPRFEFIFYRLLLDIKEVKKVIKNEINKFPVLKDSFPRISKDFQDTILESLKIANEKNHSRVDGGDMLSAVVRHNQFFQKILINKKLKQEDVENLINWLERENYKNEQRKKFWEYKNLAKRGTLAREWTSGYTVTLDRYSSDLTEIIKGKNIEFVGHKNEMEFLKRILSKSKINNALIIGNPGTGKRSLVYALAQDSLFGKGSSRISYKRIVELNMTELLAEIEDTEKVEEILNRIFQEAIKAGNVILLIDNFHNYVGRPFKAGTIDISVIISSYLRFSQFQFIAITTYEGFHRYIETNSSFLSFFRKVEVPELSPKDTLTILENLSIAYENKYKIFISYPALRQIIYFSNRYLSSSFFPEKAIDILDAVSAYVADSVEEKVVLPKHIAKIVTEKTEIPVGEMEMREKGILLNLENLIHQRIVNQKEAVSDISTALRRARSEVAVRKGPMGTFLFLGPTGVGKTETAKALAEFYFGSEKKIVRMDMSEFQTVEDIQRLIGSSEEEGILSNKVREDPFSLVLLDEIEKAYPDILNLFLQVLDEGYLTDGMGRKVDFKNTIIIATGNAGYEVILDSLENKIPWGEVKQKLLDELFRKKIFRPEFINRFDALVVFKPLSKENLLEIAELIMMKIKKNLQEKGIEFIITEELKEKIAELGYNPVFGARQMKRTVQDNVENVLATGLLSGELKRGQKVKVDPNGFKLIIS